VVSANEYFKTRNPEDIVVSSFNKQYRLSESEHPDGIYGRSDTFRLHWDIITICDMNCPYCYARKQLEWNRISRKESIDEILRKLKKVEEPLEVVLLGGEPSFSPHYFYILDELEKFALSTACISNAGGKVNDEWIHKHKKYNNFYFNFTFHPTETDINVFKNNVMTASKYNLLVNVMLLGPKYNTSITEILDFCKEHKVGVAANIPFDPSGMDSYMIKNDKYREWIAGMKPYFKEYLYFESENETRTLHDIDVYLEDLNRFKGWQCLNNNYCVDGTSTTEITRMCDKTQTEGKYMTCKLNACVCQGLLSNEKFNSL